MYLLLVADPQEIVITITTVSENCLRCIRQENWMLVPILAEWLNTLFSSIKLFHVDQPKKKTIKGPHLLTVAMMFSCVHVCTSLILALIKVCPCLFKDKQKP